MKLFALFAILLFAFWFTGTWNSYGSGYYYHTPYYGSVSYPAYQYGGYYNYYRPYYGGYYYRGW